MEKALTEDLCHCRVRLLLTVMLIPCHVHWGGYSTHLLCHTATFKFQPSYHCVFSFPFTPTFLNEHATAFGFSFFTHSLTLPSSHRHTSQSLHQTDVTVKENRVVLNLSTLSRKEKRVVNYAAWLFTLTAQTGITEEEVLLSAQNDSSLGEKRYKIRLSC